MSETKTAKSHSRNRNITLEQHIGNRILLMRHAKNMSLEQLSAVIGVSYQQLQKYEQCKNRIAASTLYQLAQYLNTSVDFYFEDYKGNIK